MLDIIERFIIKSGYVYLRLDGSTRQQDRQAKVDEFNTSASIFVFLISTTAGGLGLNLTAANRYAFLASTLPGLAVGLHECRFAASMSLDSLVLDKPCAPSAVHTRNGIKHIKRTDSVCV